MTGTLRTFSAMLNEYLTDKLLTEELIKRDWFLSNVEMDTDWKGGTLVVPFEGNAPNSVSVGGLTATTDIVQASYIRGQMTTQPEAWASLILNQRDLQEHDGKIPESTFLRILPQQVDKLMDHFKEVLSYQFIGGAAFAKVTDLTSAATGIVGVDRIERFALNQKVDLYDATDGLHSYFITQIDLNGNKVTVSATQGGAAADIHLLYTLGNNPAFYLPGNSPGSGNSTFTSLRTALLSAANGGSDTLYGQTKLAFPYLQCVQVSGAAITGPTNIMDNLFSFYLTVRQKARGNASKLLMSYKHWGTIMRAQQTQKGAYRVVVEPKKSEYGWWETTIASTTNGMSLDIVAIQEFDDDIIVAFDPGTVRIKANGGVVKHKTPDGNLYYVIRNTTGYQYVMDMVFRGDAMWTQPSSNGVLYGISYT